MINEILINKYNREILFHILILFIASTGAFLKISNFFDYILIISILIFCRNRSLLSTYYPLILFFWGFYSDLLIGYPLGYSGTIFLFFFLLKEVSYSLIDNENIRGKFYIYTFGLSIFFLCEYLAIKLFFSINLSLFIYLIKYALMLVIFYPISRIFISFENYNEK
jgi:hypothetical protein